VLGERRINISEFPKSAKVARIPLLVYITKKQELDVFRGPEYDFILVDTPPSLGILTINALTACDSVIIPMSPDVLSLQGISQLNDTIEAVKKRNNHSLIISK